MTAQQIRQAFLDFFASKGHKIVPSAPIVNKDDPTLMFTNAGMNQFKDYFLGTQKPDVRRIADTQKCLRVSGKHNDLEEVGRDGTHHTMFEMLGNWSFGDYFKKEAIAWSWELLTDVLKLPKDRLYATVFEGSPNEGVPADDEAKGYWLEVLPQNHIINGNKKDNFWEMGDTGPCGPCTEIHIDLRSDEERAKLPGEALVNKDNPRVIEIWNNVFIQFNRKADGSLEELPDKHVDTGMGFERLTLVIQGKFNTYDTDIFTPIIQFVENESGIKYTGQYPENPSAVHRLSSTIMSDIAMRVIADHIRAVSFTIADGQLPDNGGAGYVIRRILRRAVRYYYSFLNIKEPFLYRLVPMLADQFANVFPELKAQQEQVAKIIQSEEKSFLNTLENGLRRFANLTAKDGIIAGDEAFELYDTFGFPIDLTRLMAEEKGWSVDEKGFEKAMLAQKERGRADAEKTIGDWTILAPGDVEFVGYDQLEVRKSQVLRSRTVKTKKGNEHHIVLSRTPFYAESGGQHGDAGWMEFGNAERIAVIDTVKENDLTVHVVERLPKAITENVEAKVDATMRQSTSANHTGAHLLHAALHKVLGNHALQKGQDVDAARLRFDFSHFEKVTEVQVREIEAMVNGKIRENIALEEVRNMPIEDAKKLGAMMLFGEKYGETVRVITFDKDFSQELCGGTHVAATGEIGQFKIVSEGAVAAGIRRIEAVTAANAEQYFFSQIEELDEIKALLKGAQHPVKAITALQDEVRSLKKQLEQMIHEQAGAIKSQLKGQFEEVNGVKFLAAKLPLQDANAVKTLAFQLEQEVGNCVIVFGLEADGKPQIMVSVSKELTDRYNAGNMVRELAKDIQGGGGGQPFFASAGGKDASGLEKAVARAKSLLA
ncbi:MAG: alanine--tRNA ligase [Saprospiraceae bacterium]|nr:alanine--tRNA ligase [Saprospiraceae bacterium]